MADDLQQPDTDEPGITAYHASPKQLSKFKPSGFRGSTFFASTPKRAMEGAGAGANEMVMDTATELKRGPMFIHKVQIDPAKIAGLHYTPAEKEWFHSMPSRILGDDALEEAMGNRPNPYISWDDIYDHHKVGDRLYEYHKRKEPPSISYEQAYKTGKDVYGRQHSHYAPDGDESKNAQRVLKTGMKGHLVHDEAGLSIAMADPSHAKIQNVKHFANGGALDDEDEGITAYHGSPHDFEQFDMSKIGTGEGAQAYGHGLYFAENPSVAKSYRPVSSENKPVPIIIDGQKFKNPTAMQKLVAQHKGNVDAVHKAMSPHWERAASEFQSAPQDPDDLGYMLAEADHQQALAQKAELEALRGKKIEHDYSGHHEGHALAGHSYEVRINAHPDHFLDWDKPLNEQSEYVQNALAGLHKSGKYVARPQGSPYRPSFEDNPRGRQFLAGLRDALGGSKKEASQNLYAAGIKGVKYLDQGSVNATHKGTRNYVVFDDKLVNVKRKYAQGGDVGTTRYHFADGGTPTDIDPITGKPIVKKPEAGDTSSTGGGGGTGPSVGGATPAPTPSSEGVAVSTTPTSAAPSSSPTPSPGISISAPDQASLSPEMAAMLAAAQAAEPAPPAAVENAAPAAPTAPEATAAPSAPAAPAAPTASPNAVAAANDPLEGLDQAGLTPEPAAPATALSPNAMLAHAMMAEQEANPALSQAAMMDVSGIASAENASMPGEGVGPGVFGESDVSSSNSDTMMGTSDTSAAANAAAAAAADSSDNGDGGDSGGGSGGEGGGQGGDSGGGSGGSDGGGEGGGSGGDGGGGGGDGGGGGGEKRGGFIKFKGRKNKGAIDKALKVVHRKNGGKVTYNLKPDNDDRKHAGYKDDGGKMTWMSPDKFLAQTQKMQMDKEDKKSIKRFEKKIKKGKGLNPLAIYPSGGQDGRHRATAAKHEGITKVPVITWPKKASGGSIVDRALMVTSKKAKASGDAR